ncbi:MAG: DivIVA domain-containing protein [Acutalibacteraceae bacterium]|nr:DivIVA domain-containing protein [Acutalibacteraceae bacterium]
MFTSEDIKNVTFSKARGGFNPEEVDVFLDKVEADYLLFEKVSKDYQAKIAELESKVKDLEKAQNSIQNVLLSAQKLADQIVDEAKEKSDDIIKNAESNITLITAKEKEIATAFEIKAKERKETLEKELEKMVSDAKLKADSITAAAKDSVERQQVLFDKLKIEIAAFKSAVTSKYKEHLNILQEIPETVPMDPKKMAEVITAKIDAAPEAEEFIPKQEIKTENGFTVAEDTGPKEETEE